MDSLQVSRLRVLAAAGVLVAALVFAGRYLLPVGTPQSAGSSVQPRATALTRGEVVVHVVGAVRRPGLYRLPIGSRVADAVARAGGPARRADTQLVNLAAPIADGQQVVVPRSQPPAAPGYGASAEQHPSGPVHLSTATLEELDALPGIGPVTAQKILDYRRQHGAFSSVEEEWTQCHLPHATVRAALDSLAGSEQYRRLALGGALLRRHRRSWCREPSERSWAESRATELLRAIRRPRCCNARAVVECLKQTKRQGPRRRTPSSRERPVYFRHGRNGLLTSGPSLVQIVPFLT